jgi:hypothetical protein
MGQLVSKPQPSDIQRLVTYYLDLNNIPGEVRCIGIETIVIDLPIGIYNEQEIKDEICIAVYECFKIKAHVDIYQNEYFN